MARVLPLDVLPARPLVDFVMCVPPVPLALGAIRMEEYWVLVLFLLGDSPSRGRYRALSRSHQAVGEHVRRQLEARISRRGDFTWDCEWRSRVFFWTPWLREARIYAPAPGAMPNLWDLWFQVSRRHGYRLLPGPLPEVPGRAYTTVHCCSDRSILFRSDHKGEWTDWWQIWQSPQLRPVAPAPRPRLEPQWPRPWPAAAPAPAPAAPVAETPGPAPDAQ